MRLMLVCATSALAACVPQEQTDKQMSELEACVAQAVVITDAQIRSEGTTDFVQVALRNDLDWPISAALFEYRVFAGSELVDQGQADIGLTGDLAAGESDIVLISLFIPNDDVQPPYTVQASVRDVDDTFGLPLVGRARAIAPAATRVTQEQCKV